jgi:hypothetical protein
VQNLRRHNFHDDGKSDVGSELDRLFGGLRQALFGNGDSVRFADTSRFGSGQSFALGGLGLV